MFQVKGRLVDLDTRTTYGAIVTVNNEGYIEAIELDL